VGSAARAVLPVNTAALVAQALGAWSAVTLNRTLPPTAVEDGYAGSPTGLLEQAGTPANQGR
jgi:hypothetical protein